MAGDDDADAVEPVGLADRAHRAGRADRAGDVLVRARLAVGDLQQLVPDFLLERRARIVQRHGEAPALAVEVFAKLALELDQVHVVARHDRFPEAPPQRVELRLEHAPLGELEQHDAARVRRRDQRAERAFEPGDLQAVGVAAAAGRMPERLGEGLAEPALRFVSLSQGNVVHRDTPLDLLEGASQPPRARVGLEGHAEMLQEVAARARRVDAQAAQLRVADAGLRIALDAFQQPLHPQRRLAAGFERLAALARPVAGERGFAHAGEVLDVARQRLFRAAGRPAEDAGGAHAEIEQAVVAAVAARPGAVHFGDGRQDVHGREC